MPWLCNHENGSESKFAAPINQKRKSKSVPLEARRGPEGTRKSRSPDFVTTAQDGGKFVSLTHRQPLPPRNAPGTHFCLKADSTPGP